jgi:hypothetical protein
MEIKDSYLEVLDVLEGVLLSILRGIQGKFNKQWLRKFMGTS